MNGRLVVVGYCMNIGRCGGNTCHQIIGTNVDACNLSSVDASRRDVAALPVTRDGSVVLRSRRCKLAN